MWASKALTRYLVTMPQLSPSRAPSPSVIASFMVCISSNSIMGVDEDRPRYRGYWKQELTKLHCI